MDKSGITEKPMEEDIIYSEQVLKGIQEHEAEIDDIINELSIGWRIERMRCCTGTTYPAAYP